MPVPSVHLYKHLIPKSKEKVSFLVCLTAFCILLCLYSLWVYSAFVKISSLISNHYQAFHLLSLHSDSDGSLNRNQKGKRCVYREGKSKSKPCVHLKREGTCFRLGKKGTGFCVCLLREESSQKLEGIPQGIRAVPLQCFQASLVKTSARISAFPASPLRLRTDWRERELRGPGTKGPRRQSLPASTCFCFQIVKHPMGKAFPVGVKSFVSETL